MAMPTIARQRPVMEARLDQGRRRRMWLCRANRRRWLRRRQAQLVGRSRLSPTRAAEDRELLEALLDRARRKETVRVRLVGMITIVAIHLLARAESVPPNQPRTGLLHDFCIYLTLQVLIVLYLLSLLKDLRAGLAAAGLFRCLCEYWDISQTVGYATTNPGRDLFRSIRLLKRYDRLG